MSYFESQPTLSRSLSLGVFRRDLTQKKHYPDTARAEDEPQKSGGNYVREKRSRRGRGNLWNRRVPDRSVFYSRVLAGHVAAVENERGRGNFSLLRKIIRPFAES